MCSSNKNTKSNIYLQKKVFRKGLWKYRNQHYDGKSESEESDHSYQSKRSPKNDFTKAVEKVITDIFEPSEYELKLINKIKKKEAEA